MLFQEQPIKEMYKPEDMIQSDEDAYEDDTDSVAASDDEIEYYTDIILKRIHEPCSINDIRNQVAEVLGYIETQAKDVYIDKKGLMMRLIADMQSNPVYDLVPPSDEIFQQYAMGYKNRCLVCGTDMGPGNPRQLCGKSYCYSEDY